MTLLDVDRVEIVSIGGREVTTCFGVARSRLVVGDAVNLVDASGEREPAIVAGILPDYEGLKDFDLAGPGDKIRVILRRLSPRLATFVMLDEAHLDAGS